MSKKGQIYCVILNRHIFLTINSDKCTYLIENKHGNDRCNFKYGTLFSNKTMSNTCKNWSSKQPKPQKERNHLPDDLFEI